MAKKGIGSNSSLSIASCLQKKLPVGSISNNSEAKNSPHMAKKGSEEKLTIHCILTAIPKKLPVWKYLSYACLVFSAPQIQIDNFYASTKHMLLKM